MIARARVLTESARVIIHHCKWIFIIVTMNHGDRNVLPVHCVQLWAQQNPIPLPPPSWRVCVPGARLQPRRWCMRGAQASFWGGAFGLVHACMHVCRAAWVASPPRLFACRWHMQVSQRYGPNVLLVAPVGGSMHALLMLTKDHCQVAGKTWTFGAVITLTHIAITSHALPSSTQAAARKSATWAGCSQLHTIAVSHG